jgi:hypothetical protein
VSGKYLSVYQALEDIATRLRPRPKTDFGGVAIAYDLLQAALADGKVKAVSGGKPVPRGYWQRTQLRPAGEIDLGEDGTVDGKWPRLMFLKSEIATVKRRGRPNGIRRPNIDDAAALEQMAKLGGSAWKRADAVADLAPGRTRENNRRRLMRKFKATTK